MSPRISPSLTVMLTLLTAVSPPNRMVTPSACSKGTVAGRLAVAASVDSVIPALPLRYRLDPDGELLVLLVELQLSSPTGHQAFGSEAHHQDEQQTEQHQAVVREEA